MIKTKKLHMTDTKGTNGKDPRRVEAGKKAAATRGHESLSKAGHKGGSR